MEGYCPLGIILGMCDSVSYPLRSHGLQPARLLCPGGFSRQEYWNGLLYPPPGDLPKLGIEPRSPALQADSLPSESPGKPKNKVGSLSLLQRIFPTQESNWALLYCKWILYQLSYKGIPKIHTLEKNKILTLINVRAEIDKNVNKK